jgi:hypothetical protein
VDFARQQVSSRTQARARSAAQDAVSMKQVAQLVFGVPASRLVSASGLNISRPRVTLQTYRGKSLCLFVCTKSERTQMFVRTFR